MVNDKNYLTILVDSLRKKISILDKIIELNTVQLESVSGDSIDDNKFNTTIEEKDKCIKEIENLDNGFETVYSHIKEELANNPDAYKAEVATLKELIATITEKSMEIQISEKRNEQAVLSKMSDERKRIYQSKANNKVVSDYYKNMNKMNIVDPQFLDKKN